jgi:hypothetical protein
MATPEGKVKNAVKKALKIHGAYYHMPVQNGMGSPTLDFVGCYRGKFFAIETKAPGGKPTPRQLQTIVDMESAGAKVFVVDGNMDELNEWLVFGGPPP